MTPRDEEVAFLLEGVPGVVAVYAVRDRPPMRWAVRYASTRGLAAAHYALRRMLPYEECHTVQFFMDAPDTFLHGEVRPLVLSAHARESARARIAELATPLPGPSSEGRPAGYSVLVVDPATALAELAREAFGPDVEHIHVRGAHEAASLLASHHFDLMFCTARVAYEPGGLFAALADRQHLANDFVVIVARDDETYAGFGRASSRGESFHLYGSVKANDLRLARAHALHGGFTVTKPEPRTRPAPRVLVIDEREPNRRVRGIDQVFVREPWDAVDRIGEEWDLVVCSFDMMLGARKLYSVLLKLNPGLKRRFVFLVNTPDPAQPRTIGRPLSTMSLLERIHDTERQ